MIKRTLFFKSLFGSLLIGMVLILATSCNQKNGRLAEVGPNAEKALPKAFTDSIPEDMLKWYDDNPDNGEIRIDVRDDLSVANWKDFMPTDTLSRNAPNILFVLYDDTGLGAWSPYGGSIKMPTLDALAKDGLIYTQWHTTALCSPTRSTIMTGRNHHLNGMASITETADGFPGANGRVPDNCVPFAQVLQDNGYSTFWIGKNHNVPETDVAPGGYRGEWPCQQGFDRFYGFLGGETNNWYPDLVEDNRFVEAPTTPEDSDDPENFPEEGYHLSRDFSNKALEILKNQQASNPHKPWYMWYNPGANHAPHHSPPSYTQLYIDNKTFVDGYEIYRESIWEKMKEKGIIPEETVLTELNFLDRNIVNPLDTITPWDSLELDAQNLYIRMAEVYAGFSTYTDVQIGRIIDYLKETDQYENTIILYAADNGASGEGSPSGSVNENKFFNGYPDELEENLKYMNVLGTAETYNHFPTGWAAAFSTPFKMFKRYSQFAGGTNDPLIITWPKYTKEIAEDNRIRHQYHHSVDIVPTLLDAIGIDMPEVYNGVKQKPLSGVSMLYTITDPTCTKDTDTEKKVQYYSMLGTRGIWKEGWKAVELHAPTSGKGNFNDEGWELYHVAKDRSESKNLAAEKGYEGKLQEMIDAWYEQAAINNVLPLDDRAAAELLTIERPNPEPPRYSHKYYPYTAPVPEGVAANIRGRSYSVEATLETGASASDSEGVLFAHGSRFGGHTMYIHDDSLIYLYNFLGVDYKQYKVHLPIIDNLDSNTEYNFIADFEIKPELTKDTAFVGIVTLFVEGHPELGKASLLINTQPAKFTLSGDGLCVGYDSADAVTTDYPNLEEGGRFTGGDLKYVEIKARGDVVRNLKAEARRMMLRQ